MSPTTYNLKPEGSEVAPGKLKASQHPVVSLYQPRCLLATLCTPL
jgi:hypothetical protein